MEIIPAIDIIEGKCVRLSAGKYEEKTVYHEDPLEVAQEFEHAGIRRLHLVDLDGAKVKKVINWKVIESITKNTKLKVDFGGGVQSDGEVERLFDLGVAQVTGGSIAVKDPLVFKQWIYKYGPDKIILGADVRENYIAVHGWEETTAIHILDFLEDYVALGIKDVICTDIDRDGMLTGPSVALYVTILEQFPKLNLISSGGVSSAIDIEKLLGIGVYGAIIGKAIYEERITMDELKQYL